MKNITLSVELGDKEVRIAILYSTIFGTKDKLTRVEFDRLLLPEGVIEQGIIKDPVSFISVIKDYKTKKLKTKNIVKTYIALPYHNGFLRSYTMPWVPEKDRLGAVRFLVQDDIPVLSSELIIDYQLISEDKAKKEMEVLVAGAKRQYIHQIAQAFESAGYRLCKITFSVLTVPKALKLHNNEEIVYLQTISLNAFQVTLYRGLIPLTTKTIAVSGILDSAQVSAEIARMLALYSGGNFGDLADRVVWFDNLVPKGIIDSLNEKGYAEYASQMSLGNLSQGFLDMVGGTSSQINTLSDFEGGWEKTLILLGNLLANRNTGDINLWKETLDQLKSRQARIAVAAVSLTVLGSMLWHYFNLRNHEAILLQELAKTQSQVQSSMSNLRAEQDLEKNWQLLIEKPTKIGETINQLANSAKAAGIRLEKIEYRTGQFFIRGIATKPSDLEELLRSLTSFGWSPVLTAYLQNEQQMISFALTSGSQARGR